MLETREQQWAEEYDQRFREYEFSHVLGKQENVSRPGPEGDLWRGVRFGLVLSAAIVAVLLAGWEFIVWVGRFF